ncbi:MAG: hydrolase [Desulfobacterales bacterium]|nr:hydrolase [Desulfobacterales bacterium]
MKREKMKWGKGFRLCILSGLLVLLGATVCFAWFSGLTFWEKKMPEARYYDPTFAPFPEEVAAGLSNGPVESGKALKFEDLNDLLEPGYLAVENGYGLNPDGTGFVAVRTEFPGASAQMIHWWFWWHALKDIRYKIWCPGAHYGIGVEDMAQMNDAALSYQQRYLNNPQYPVEDVGTGVRRLSIRFISPEDFGFDTARFKAAGIEAVVCGVVGYMVAGVPVEHTYMVHMFRRTADGLELRSRFWLGQGLDSQALRKLAITQNTAMSLAFHCATEYNHLAEFLPEIFEEFK